MWCFAICFQVCRNYGFNLLCLWSSKSTPSILPTYFLSLFPVLVEVANCIEKLEETFYGVGLVRNINSTWLNGLRFVNQFIMEG